MRTWLFLLCPLAIACVEPIDAPTDDPEAAALTLGPVQPGPPGPVLPQFATPNRMVWSDGNGTAKVQLLGTTNGVVREVTFTEPWPREAVGVAGDRLLWMSTSGWAELWTLDANLAVTTRRSLTSPGPNYLAVGLSLKSDALGQCWSSAASQGYNVLWDRLPSADDALGQVAIQQIDGAGVVASTVTFRKPFVGLQAVWYGRTGDGVNRVVFRSGTSGRDVISYRVDLTSTTPPTASLSQPASVTGPSGFRAVSAGLVTSTALLVAGTRSQVLFASHRAATDGGQAQMPWYTPAWAPFVNSLTGNAVVTLFAGGNGYYARSYTSNPPTCAP